MAAAYTALPSRSDIVLALDVGSKKTGVAVGNRISGGARPLGIVRGGRTRQLEAIGEYIAEWQPALIVIGLPLHMDGREHKMTAYVRGFVAALTARHALPVAFADERRSSIKARGVTRHDEVDDSAAAIILQEWLDKMSGKN